MLPNSLRVWRIFNKKKLKIRINHPHLQYNVSFVHVLKCLKFIQEHMYEFAKGYPHYLQYVGLYKKDWMHTM